MIERKDVVQVEGGIVQLPSEFREVTRLANQAGREGWTFVDVEYGIDAEEARRVFANPEPDVDGFGIETRITITYRREHLGSDPLRTALERIRDLRKQYPAAHDAANWAIEIATNALAPREAS
jgi:hypothetical protein